MFKLCKFRVRLVSDVVGFEGVDGAEEGVITGVVRVRFFVCWCEHCSNESYALFVRDRMELEYVYKYDINMCIEKNGQGSTHQIKTQVD